MKRVVYAILLLVLLSIVFDGIAMAGEAAVIKDQAGRMIPVNLPFGRIISLYGAHTHNLKALGLNKEILGICPGDDWEGKPIFSYHDGMEKFLAARPDLVLVRPMIDQGYPQLIKGLERSGITVASFQPSDVNEMFDYWMILGQLTGKTDQARKMVRQFKDEITRIQKITSGLSYKKKVYFEAIHDRMKTFTPGSMAIFALENAGGINIAADAPSVRGTNIAFYGKERILSKARDIDIFLSQKGTMNQPTVSMIVNEPGFGVIKAVQEGRIFIVDEKLVSRPTLDLLEGVRTIGKILYPESFGKVGTP
ncbi:MAG: peptide ABC transporter substrate-binding protein [Desulfobacterales bacterium CG23_combo_of_CG06-09_8_20_14_all_51_8]|nr:MAG: peptide ABC transporter substrate-binding protein [Desulfobacterales bacterium CG23_combo_of_CG06-09_8_20_14_all_51_8]